MIKIVLIVGLVLIFWPIILAGVGLVGAVSLVAFALVADAMPFTLKPEGLVFTPKESSHYSSPYVPYYLSHPECTKERIAAKEAQGDTDILFGKNYVTQSCKLMAESDEARGFRPVSEVKR